MSENDIFDNIFKHRLREGQNYALLTHEYHKEFTIANPTMSDWEDMLALFELRDCYIDPRLPDLGRLWSMGNLSEKYNTSIPYATTPITGLSILKNLHLIDLSDEQDYVNMFFRIHKLFTMACEIMKTPVFSPPVLSNIHHNMIHPGSTLSQAHQFINKPLRIMLMSPKQDSEYEVTTPINIIKINKEVKTLSDLESCYKGELVGFFEKRKGLINHIHLYSYHGDWNKPDENGYIEYPKFSIKKFYQTVNELLPDDCETISVFNPFMNQSYDIKITDDVELLENIFTVGSKVCFK